MDRFIIDENTQAGGAHQIHNVTHGCTQLPHADAQFTIGYFASAELAYKQARMNWPREKVSPCTECCGAE